MHRSVHGLFFTAIIVTVGFFLVSGVSPAVAGTVVDLGETISSIIPDPIRSEFYVAMYAGDHDIIRVSSTGSSTGTIVEPDFLRPVEMAVAPDGSELYVTYQSINDIHAYSLRSLDPAGEVDLPSWFYPRALEVTATRIYALGHNDVLAIIDRSTFDVVYLGNPPGVNAAWEATMAVSPDGTRLLIEEDSSGTHRLVIVDVSNDSPIRVGHDCQDTGGGVTRLIFSPDGSRLYRSGGWVEIYNARPDGLMTKTHNIPVSSRGMVLSSNGQRLWVSGTETFHGPETITKINTQSLLPYRVVELQSTTNHSGMALSYDDTVIAIPVNVDGSTTGLEFINASHETPNRGGWFVRPEDSITGQPFERVWTEPTINHESYLDVKAGTFAMVSMPEGPQEYEVRSIEHWNVMVYPEIFNGIWDNLGSETFDRLPDHALEDAKEVCIEQPLVPGPNGTVTIHGRNFTPGTQLLQVTGDPIQFGAYSQINWATMSAVVTLDPDHNPGFYRDNFHAFHTDGDPYPGQYFVSHPNDAHLGFTIFGIEVNEDGGTAELTVGRFHNSTGAVSIEYETDNGTAHALDYTPTSGTLTWADGDTNLKYISVPILIDAHPEPAETFEVLLHSPSTGAVANGVRAEVTIIDTNSSAIEFAASAAAVDEDAGTVSLEVTRAGDLGFVASMDWATHNGSADAGDDFTYASGTLSWGVDEDDPKFIVIDILDDALIEGDEDFSVELDNPSGNAYAGTNEAVTVTIIDDEIMEVAFSAATFNVDEGAGAATVTAHRTGASNGIVTVNYATTDGTAVAGTDYTAAAGILTWLDGDTAPKPFSVFVTNDSEIEPDETITIDLSNPTGGAALGDLSSAVLTIKDNDGTEFTLDQAEVHGIEGGSGVEIVVHRTGSDNTQTVTVDYDTADDTATAGLDYVPASGTLTWIGGDVSDQSFTVTIIDDAVLEGYEIVDIVLSNPTGDGVLGDPATATLSIEDDEWVETAVNTETSQPQTRPDLAMAADGSSVVVWESYLQDGAGWGIFGQRFDPTGAPAGAEFQVNSTAAGDQRFAAVAMQPGGGFTVVWSDADASGGGIHGRSFNKSGAPLGASFLVNTTTTDNQSEPDIAIDGAGAVLVVWQSNDTGDLDIRGRAFNAAGSPIGNDFAINTTTVNEQQLPSVAGSAGGGFVAVWQSIGQDGPANGIIARRLASNGTPVGVEVIVNDWTSGDQIAPDVGVTATGAFLVAWQDTTHQDGMGSSIRARPFSPAAAPLSGDIQLNSYWIDDQKGPKVTSDGAGLVQVAWESTDQDGSDLGIYSRTIGADGLFVGLEIRLNTFVTGIQHRPAVARSDSGAYWAAWASGGQDGSGDGIFGIFGPAPVITELFRDGFESGGTTMWSSSSQ